MEGCEAGFVAMTEYRLSFPGLYFFLHLFADPAIIGAAGRVVQGLLEDRCGPFFVARGSISQTVSK